MLNYSKYPNQGNVGGVRLYLEHGVEPGSFLEAIICNDLREACMRADHINQRIIWDIVYWFYNEAPIGTWGSSENYRRWLSKFRKESAEL
jgi:hypothetical protein